MSPGVLIVDDDMMNRELLQTVFERSGYRVINANNGKAALKLAADEQPAVILCDVRMSGMSGYEVCAALKADPMTTTIPVIILTGYEDEEERQKALAAGAVDFIPKMRGWQVLVEKVKQLTA
jgi:CheY-like chemotaxis protein